MNKTTTILAAVLLAACNTPLGRVSGSAIAGGEARAAEPRASMTAAPSHVFTVRIVDDRGGDGPRWTLRGETFARLDALAAQLEEQIERCGADRAHVTVTADLTVPQQTVLDTETALHELGVASERVRISWGPPAPR